MNFQKLYDEATPAQRHEFERRQAICLRLAIVIKIAILGALILIGCAEPKPVPRTYQLDKWGAPIIPDEDIIIRPTPQ